MSRSAAEFLSTCLVAALVIAIWILALAAFAWLVT